MKTLSRTASLPWWVHWALAGNSASSICSSAPAWPSASARPWPCLTAVAHNFLWHRGWTWRDRAASAGSPQAAVPAFCRAQRARLARRQRRHHGRACGIGRARAGRQRCGGRRVQPGQLRARRSAGIRRGLGRAADVRRRRRGGARAADAGRLEGVREGDRAADCARGVESVGRRADGGPVAAAARRRAVAVVSARRGAPTVRRSTCPTAPCITG